MIDTVRFMVAGRPVDTLDSDWDQSDFRRLKFRDHFGDTELLSDEGTVMTHRETGLRLITQGKSPWATVTCVEASLPRVLHGSNGRLIADQRQLDEARHRLVQLAEERTEGPLHWDHVTRLDLVWQFRGHTENFLRDMMRSKHPRVRKAKIIHEGESVQFPGKERFLRVYDKEKEQLGRRGEVIRVELQMRGHAIRTPQFGCQKEGNQYSFLRQIPSWSALYTEYRDFLCQFEPVVCPVVGKQVDFLVLCQEQELTDKNGRSLLDLWARDKHPKHVSRVKSQMAKTRLKYQEWSFRRLLPELPDVETLPLIEVVRSAA